MKIQGNAVVDTLRWSPVNGEKAAGADKNCDYNIKLFVAMKILLRRKLTGMTN